MDTSNARIFAEGGEGENIEDDDNIPQQSFQRITQNPNLFASINRPGDGQKYKQSQTQLIRNEISEPQANDTEEQQQDDDDQDIFGSPLKPSGFKFANTFTEQHGKQNFNKSIASNANEFNTSIKLDQTQMDDDDDQKEEEVIQYMQKATDFKGNMKNFMRQYGVSIDIPSFYRLSSAIYPNDTDYILLDIQYVIPQGEDMNFRTCFDDGTQEIKRIIDTYPDEYKKCGTIQLLKKNGNTMTIEKQVFIHESRRNEVKFSPNGQYLALYRKKISRLDVYMIHDNNLHDVLDVIDKNGAALKSFGVDDPQNFQGIKNLKFDADSRYLWAFGNDKAVIVQLDLEDDIPKQVQTYKLNKDKFKIILDVQVLPDPVTNDYQCQIACLRQNFNAVKIFDITDEDFTKEKIINFTRNITGGIRVKISNNFEKVLFTSKNENYVLEMEYVEMEGNQVISYNQNSLNWLDNQNVVRLKNIGNSDFAVVYHEDFDQKISISQVFSGDHGEIECQVEPGIIFIMDLIKTGNKYQMALNQDQKFVFDEIKSLAKDISEASDEEDDGDQQWVMDTSEGFSSSWPYVTFSGLNKTQLLFNGIKRDELIRIPMPEETVSQPFSHITDTLELYIIAELPDRFEMYRVSLNKFKDKRTKEDQIYTKEKELTIMKDGDMQKMQAFHIRGQSSKDEPAQNKAIAFFIFNDTLYSWMRGQVDEDKIKEEFEVWNADFDVINDSNIIVSTQTQDKNGFDVFRLIKIEIDFSTYQFEPIYEETEQIQHIINYGFDEQEHILIILKQQKGKKKFHLSIAQLVEDQVNVIYSSQITNQKLIGRIKSGLFMVVNGHMYFNNEVIKIRYDLLTDQKSLQDYTEAQLFDFYPDVLQLDQDEFAETDMPVVENLSQRLIYIIKNRVTLGVKRVVIMPFLHIRNILMRALRPSQEYFSTIVERKTRGNYIKEYITVNITEYKVNTFNQKGFQTTRFDYAHMIKEFGKPKCVSNNGQFFIFKKSDSIILNIFLLTPDEMLLLKTIDVGEDLKNYITHNAEQYQSEKDMKFMRTNIIDENGAHHEFENINNYNYQYIINDNLDVCIKIDPRKGAKGKFDKQGTMNQKNALAGNLMEGLRKNIQNEEKLQEKRQKVGAFFYIQKGSYQLDLDKLRDLDNWVQVEKALQQTEELRESNQPEQYCFRMKHHSQFEKGLSGFSMNTKDIFFWNVQKAWRFQIKPFEKKMIELNLNVDPEEQNTKIRKVVTGSTEDKVIIIIKQSKSLDSSLVWDIVNDNEIDAFDHHQTPQVFWDTSGDAFIQEGDNTLYFPEMGCASKAFKLKSQEYVSIKKQDKNYNLRKSFSPQYGLRFDAETHSEILMDGVINLSYSYMTFMMQSIDEQNNDDYMFDQEEYSYIINKSTPLHENTLIDDSAKLKYVLENLMAIDPVLCEQLHYVQYIDPSADDLDESGSPQSRKSLPRSRTIDTGIIKEDMRIETPLHKALWQQNTRSINLILTYQAQMDYSSFNTFKDIISELVDYKSFFHYLIEQPFETIQLQNKQSLKQWSDDKMTKTIVDVNDNNCSYVDDKYYKDVMEVGREDANRYPVTMKLVEVGWILREEPKTRYGLKFLQAIYNSENLEIYNTDTVKIIIEYFFKRYKANVWQILLPLYVVSLLIFLLTAYYVEWLEDHKSVHKDAKKKETAKQRRHLIKIILAIVYMLSTTANLGIVAIKTYFSPTTYWQGSQWGVIDTTFVVFSYVISALVLTDNKHTVQTLRFFEAFTSILIAFRGLYFLELDSKFSPLILIMFKVFGDIQYFVLVLLLVIFSFTVAFWSIGQNQLAFDGIDADKAPMYVTKYGAVQFMYYLVLGEVGTSGGFEEGGKSQIVILWVFFVIVTFIAITVMMNMLVAIMGDTFAKNYENEEQNVLRSKLRFVIDNWISPVPVFSAKERKSTMYLVAAMLLQDEDQEVEVIKDLSEEIKILKQRNNKETQKILTQLLKIKALQQ